MPNVDKSTLAFQQQTLRLLLRQIRRDANLRQTDLARKLQTPQSFVSRYESGQRRLDLAELQIVCEAVGVPLLDLVKRFEERAS